MNKEEKPRRRIILGVSGHCRAVLLAALQNVLLSRTESVRFLEASCCTLSLEIPQMP